MKNFFVTMAVIAVMILTINWILKDYVYYRRVVKAQNLASTERYLDEFPGGFYAEEVRKQHDEYSFLQAKSDGTKESYDKYIREFGNSGKHIDEAIEQSEELHYRDLKNRADLEEIIRYLKRSSDTKFKAELEELEEKLWKKNRENFLTYARSNGYSPSLLKIFDDVFTYMEENRFTRLYVGATVDKELLKDWNDYSKEVQLLWDEPANLVNTFDANLVLNQEEGNTNDSIYVFPIRTEIPSELPPSSVKGYIRRDRIRRLYADFPSQFIAEIEQSGVKFPILHAVRNANEIPKYAPAFVLTCKPMTRETKINGMESPAFSMMLKNRTSPKRRSEVEDIRVQFNGYMIEIDVNWSFAYKQGQETVGEIFSAAYTPQASTYFLSRNKLSNQYTEMVGETLNQFKNDLAKNTVFDFRENKK